MDFKELFTDLLSDISANPRIVNEYYKDSILCPIHILISGDDLESIQQISTHNLDYDKEDKLGNSPIHYAVELGYTDIIEHLLKNNVLLDRKDCNDNDVIDKIISSNNQNIENIFADHSGNRDFLDKLEARKEELRPGNPKPSKRSRLSPDIGIEVV